jgi:hypothetical protein
MAAAAAAAADDDDAGWPAARRRPMMALGRAAKLQHMLQEAPGRAVDCWGEVLAARCAAIPSTLPSCATF